MARSDAEQFLLSLFLKPRQFETITNAGWNDVWRAALGQEPGVVLSSLLTGGLLQPCGVAGLLDVKYRVPELIAICKSNGLSNKGKKADLIATLANSLPSSELSRLVAGVQAFECSARGREIGEAYKCRSQRERTLAEQQCISALERGELRSACVRMIDFERRLAIPRGLGIDRSTHDPSHELELLTNLFRTNNIRPGDTPDAMVIASAMAILWGESAAKWLPKGEGSPKRRTRKPEEKAQEVKARMMALRAGHEASLRQYRANSDVVIGVKILAANSCCDVCRARVGRYSLDEVPLLPHEDCRHEMGCRCTYVPLTSYSDSDTESRA